MRADADKTSGVRRMEQNFAGESTRYTRACGQWGILEEWGQRIGCRLAGMLQPKRGGHFFEIGRPALGGFIDGVRIDPSGIIRIVGWCKTEFNPDPIPSVHLDGQSIRFLHHFRFGRRDVISNVSDFSSQAGVALDYLVSAGRAMRSTVLEIRLEENNKVRFKAGLEFITPHYRELLSTSEVWHREKIYGSGPPNAVLNPEIVEIARELKGPVLDFGCGSGLLVRHLRTLGTEAYGLELNSRFEQPTHDESTRIITLYDGVLPSPFEDGTFRSVVCSEVLEHIPDHEAAITDIARIVTEKVVFTVPDASAIPMGFRHGAVPWHLLEGTHVNFFTQQSLKHALEPHFSRVEFGRVGCCHLNDSEFYVSLVAFCWK